jgi:hypothetical protein
VPETISFAGIQNPTWVSAKFAEASGGLRTKRFSADSVEMIERVLAESPLGGCHESGPVIEDYYGGQAAVGSVEEAVSIYPVAAVGRVVAMEPGFHVGVAGTMLEARAQSPSNGIEAGERFLVFVPLGDFVFSGKRICAKDPRYWGLPRLGDLIVVFSRRSVYPDVTFLSLDYPRNLAVISEGVLHLAPDLRLDRELSSSSQLDAEAFFRTLAAWISTRHFENP